MVDEDGEQVVELLAETATFSANGRHLSMIKDNRWWTVEEYWGMEDRMERWNTPWKRMEW